MANARSRNDTNGTDNTEDLHNQARLFDTSRESPANPDTTRADEQRESSDKLLNDFDFEKAMRPGSGAYHVDSSDTELGGGTQHTQRGQNKGSVPFPFRQVPEGKALFDFIRRPSTDIRQIQQRQRIVDALHTAPNRNTLIEQKNNSYTIFAGINELFSTFHVSERCKMQVLRGFREGHPEATDIAKKAIAEISSGTKAYRKLIELMEGIHDPSIESIVKSCKKNLPLLESLTYEYIKHDSGAENALHRASGIVSNVTNIGMVLEFADIAAKDGYARATYSPVKPYEYKQGWNFARSKKATRGYYDSDIYQQVSPAPDQIANNSPKEHSLTVYSGSNMSGKSFQLKTVFYMQMLAQAFGYVPCEQGNFSVYTSFHYLDRAATDPNRNLSAFGSEVVDWNKTISLFGNRPYICCDETFSTTSPEDQYRLLVALDLYLRQRGARLFLATHNETFIRRNQEDQNVGIYHLETSVDEKGKVMYTHRLTSGAGDSMALDVARSMGLSPELLAMAARYRDGYTPPINTENQHEYKALSHYTSEQREAMKQTSMSVESLMSLGKGEKGLVHLFSEDPDFRENAWNSIETGYSPYKSAGSWPHGPLELSRRTDLKNFLLHAPAMSPQEVHERQHMFSLLAQAHDFEEVRELELRLLDTVKLFTGITGSIGNLTRFNIELNPLTGRYNGGNYGKRHEYLAYLRLNQLLLKDAFPFSAELAELEELVTLEDEMRRKEGGIDIQRIFDFDEKEGDAIITDPEVINAIEKLKIQYKTEYPLAFPEGEPTLARYKYFYMWLKKKFEYSYTGNDKDYTVFETYLNGKGNGSLASLGENIVDCFSQYAEQYGEDDPDKWGGAICADRILALIKRVEISDQNRGKDRDYIAYDLKRYLGSLEGGILRMKYGDMRGEAIARPQAVERISTMMDRLDRLNQQIPPVSLFQEGLDIDAIRPMIHALTKDTFSELRTGRKDYQDMSHSDWTALYLSVLMHEEDAVASYLKRLRSFDSVHLSQIANSLEADLAEVVTKDDEVSYLLRRFSISTKNDPTPRKKPIICSGKKLVEKIKEVHLLGLEEAYGELKELDAESREIAIMGRGIIGSRYSTLPYTYEKVKKCLLPKGTREADTGYTQQCIEWFIAEKYDGDMSRAKPYVDQLPRFDNNAMDKFINNEMKTATLARQRFDEMGRRLSALGEKAIKFVEKYNINFERENRKSIMDEIEQGELRYLHESIRGRMNRNGERMGKKNHWGVTSETVTESVRRTTALSLIGTMIHQQQHAPVEFNTTGDIRMTDAWNLWKGKGDQVRGGIEFGGEEKIKMINGANMSGKTFWLKKGMISLAWAMATGHAPAASATMPMIDRIIYLDRVLAKSDNNLSAFGNEVTFWNTFLELLEQESSSKTTVSFLDEIFSTTSPNYQAALSAALLTHIASRGGRVAVASHHHQLIDRLREAHPELAVPYFFTGHTETTDGGVKLVSDYMMERGHVGSQAVEVARNLKFPEEILKIAELIR